MEKAFFFFLLLKKKICILSKFDKYFIWIYLQIPSLKNTLVIRVYKENILNTFTLNFPVFILLKIDATGMVAWGFEL